MGPNICREITKPSDMGERGPPGTNPVTYFRPWNKGKQRARARERRAETYPTCRIPNRGNALPVDLIITRDSGETFARNFSTFALAVVREGGTRRAQKFTFDLGRKFKLLRLERR